MNKEAHMDKVLKETPMTGAINRPLVDMFKIDRVAPEDHENDGR